MIERVRYYAGLFNWGDDINPELYRLITGKECKKMHVLDESPIDHIMMCGSILPYANEHSIVWGTGFMHKRSSIGGVPKKICAVRGPLTAKRLEELGIEVNVPYGDPSMFIKNDETFKVWGDQAYFPKNHKYGVVAHYIDRKLVENWPEDIIKIDIQTHLKLVVSQIVTCEKIISSSLHGLILADMYNIPALWVKLSDNLSGDDMKFHDYFASIGRKDVEYFDLRGGYTDEVKNAFVDYKVNIDLDALYEACPLVEN